MNMRPLLLLLLVVSFPALAEEFGDWRTGWGQGVSEYWTENKSGDKLYISCGEAPYGPPANLLISIGGDDFTDPNSDSSITFRAGNKSGTLAFKEGDKLDTFCVVCLSNYEYFWNAIRNGTEVIFENSVGKSVEFSLAGSAKALPTKPCVTEVELITQSDEPKVEGQGVVSAENTAEKSSGQCEIEDWKFSQKGEYIFINGAAGCEKGKLSLRLYDTITNEFVASGFTFVEGYVFQTYISGVAPTKMKIKYVIE